MIGLKAAHEEFQQEVKVHPKVLEYLSRHRQRHLWNKEAGGQLFGQISSDIIYISAISGPYPKDERGPCHYRSHPQSAQTEIARQQKLGHVYIGEWHTHAEKIPQASGFDIETMCKLKNTSSLSTNGLILIIVGQHDGWKGISFYTFMDNAFLQWSTGVDDDYMKQV